MLEKRMNWEKLLSTKRVSDFKNCDKKKKDSQFKDVRSAFERDFDQMVFSYPFRRLQDKTQVIPFPEYDFVHNRLTHSLEVASVGRSLGKMAAKIIFKEMGGVQKVKKNFNLCPSDIGALVAAACLAHDIGNPPFGHSGEDAISSFFHNYRQKHIDDIFSFASSLYLQNTDIFNKNYQSIIDIPKDEIEESGATDYSANELKKCVDLLKFEGNANGFRIITQNCERGINPTCALLGTYSKYPRESYVETNPFLNQDKSPASQKKYGFFQKERELFKGVAKELDLIPIDGIGENDIAYRRHPLAFLMEAADDIANSIIDFEDGCRLKLIDLEKSYSLVGQDKTPKQILIEIAKQDFSFDRDKLKNLDTNKQIAYLRSKVINVLIHRTFKIFKQEYENIMVGKFDKPLIDCLENQEIKNGLKLMKELVKEHIYHYKPVLESEVSGFEVMEHLIASFSKTCNICYSCGEIETVKDKKIKLLMPKEYQPEEEATPENLTDEDKYERFLKILDYVSGMTDNYATNLYRKIKGIDK